jgi:hypothetical protein
MPRLWSMRTRSIRTDAGSLRRTGNLTSAQEYMREEHIPTALRRGQASCNQRACVLHPWQQAHSSVLPTGYSVLHRSLGSRVSSGKTLSLRLLSSQFPTRYGGAVATLLPSPSESSLPASPLPSAASPSAWPAARARARLAAVAVRARL